MPRASIAAELLDDNLWHLQYIDNRTGGGRWFRLTPSVIETMLLAADEAEAADPKD